VIDDAAQLGRALNAFRAQGLAISIDDFGAGYAGLNLLADFQPRVPVGNADTPPPSFGELSKKTIDIRHTAARW
jgi:hypothetical protein